MGADHRYVMRTMQDKTLDDLIRQGEILRRVKRVMEGKVAYVYMSYQEAKKLHISYEDIHPISSEIVKISRWGFLCMRKHRIFGDVLSDRMDNG